MRRTVFVMLGGMLLLAMGCGSKSRLEPGTEGYVPVDGGRIWYRVEGAGKATPIILIHGGPGATHHYLKTLAALGDDRPVILYDQLGAGRADSSLDSTRWTIEHYVGEVGALRKALGLEKVHLYGSSWGTIVATEYMLTKPEGVKSLILASPALDIPQWIRDSDTLRAELPDSTRTAIERHERDRTFTDPEYQAAMMEYYRLHLARRQPWSADIDSTFGQLNQRIYQYMQGPSEFTIIGTIENYDVTPRLHEIAVPTLFTAGRYDEARPSTVERFRSLIPGAEIAIFEQSGHLTMQDEPERYVQVLREFLKRADAR